jgi:RHS repeat-associated protein
MKFRRVLASFVMLIVLGALAQVNGTPTASFYQYDGRGTVRMLTNSAGAVTDEYEYDAFGNLISSTGSTPNAYLYRGEQFDSDLGLYYLRARWYNPVTGRFMTRDPYSGSIYDPASLHRYNYGRANPANYIDPSGRASIAEAMLTDAMIFTGEAAAVTALGYTVRCAYYAEASALDLVGQHMNQDITQFGMLFQGCAAQITVKQFLQDTAANMLFMGAFSMLGRGVGWLLEDAAEGSAPLLAEETASTPFQQIMSKLQGMDFSSPPNTALFYSGPGTGDIATALAEEKGLTTISSTQGGAYLESLDLYGPNSPVSESEAGQLWTYASSQFASGTSGDVLAILNNPSPARIYLSTEKPILLNNPTITSVTETSIPDLFIVSGNFH